jgi:ribosome biogenesis GTPase / thiamine phosphate phosphatase
MGKKDRRKKKIRAEFRKNQQTRTRQGDLTRGFVGGDADSDAAPLSERVSGKGQLTRHRTVIGDEAPAGEGEAVLAVQLDVDTSKCLAGRVMSVHGRDSFVLTEDGREYRCAVRRLLKSLAIDQRNVVVAGDRVLFRPAQGEDGVIERVEPRRGTISRTSRGRQHVIVSNVDQLLIVSSAAEPVLKPNLIDRFLVTAEASRIRAIICINKIDLIEPADLAPLAGVYGQMGYPVLLLSATAGLGVERLRELIRGRQTVLAGQSGVGKSSLLNAIEPRLGLRVREVSEENQKGRHTTTAARLIPLDMGGYVVDTPGIRQFQLWDVSPEEVAGFFRDLRPYVSHCRYPDCTHIHEDGCAVKGAVADGRLDVRRYESYCGIFAGEME